MSAAAVRAALLARQLAEVPAGSEPDVASVTRGLVNPVTGVLTHYVNANGDLVNAAGNVALGAIGRAGAGSANIAYVSTLGDDATGQIGSSDRAFLTMQAAYDAGATVLVMSVGTFAGLTLTADAELWIVGYGAWDVLDQTHAKTIIQQIDCGAHQLYLWDVHGFSCQIEEITAAGADGANGAAGQNGGNGGNGPLIGLRRCVVLSLTGRGGNGGNSGSGNHNGGNGGVGSVFDLEHCFIPLAVSTGGTGGTKSGSGTAGAGGDGGTITAKKNCSLSAVSSTGGEPGATGTGGDGGEVTLTDSVVAGDGQIGSGGGTGGDGGAVSATFCRLPTPNPAGSFTKVACVVDGTFAAS